MKTDKCFIILFRRFNDLDHTLPIVHVLAEYNPEIKVYYLCTSRFWNFKKEEIFKSSLINSSNVYLGYFEDFIFKTKNRFLKNALLFFFKIKFFRNFYFKKNLSNFKLIKFIIDIPNKRSLLINYFISYLKLESNRSKLYGFRHALWNKIETENDINEIQNCKKIILQNSDLDKIILTNEREFLIYKKNNTNYKKFFFLGNIRFSHEWNNILVQNFPFEDKSKNKRKEINVLYMDHSPFLGLKGDIIYESLKKIKTMNNIRLVIKPNTNSLHKSDLNLSSKKLLNLNCIDYESSSRNLISEADIVINTQSSIAVEVLLQNKLLVSASHYHTKKMLWEEYGACAIVKNDDELINLIKNYSKDKKNNFYIYKNVKNYLDEIQAAKYGDHIFERYNKFFMDI